MNDLQRKFCYRSEDGVMDYCRHAAPSSGLIVEKADDLEQWRLDLLCASENKHPLEDTIHRKKKACDYRQVSEVVDVLYLVSTEDLI